MRLLCQIASYVFDLNGKAFPKLLFDAVGGAMGEVVKATSKLTPEDRAAIAAYLGTLPPVPNPKAPATQPEF